MRSAFPFGVFAAAIMAAVPTAVAAREYRVGDVVLYQNPYDGTPARKARVTRVEPDKIWLDFAAFQPNLSVTERDLRVFKSAKWDI